MRYKEVIFSSLFFYLYFQLIIIIWWWWIFLTQLINYRKKKRRRNHLENILNQVELLTLSPKVVYMFLLYFLLFILSFFVCWNQLIQLLLLLLQFLFLYMNKTTNLLLLLSMFLSSLLWFDLSIVRWRGCWLVGQVHSTEIKLSFNLWIWKIASSILWSTNQIQWPPRSTPQHLQRGSYCFFFI